MSSQQQLYPIRIDATSNDRQLRIVDTLLWDATLLKLDTNNNADQLAQQIVADTVVLGMGRAARHFTNRWEIGGDSAAEMTAKIAAQIREQWRAIQQRRACGVQDGSSSATGKKRKRDNDEPTATAASSVKEEEKAANESNPKENAASVSSPNLIPIHLRMSIHGVRIHDDFDYDPTGILNPVQMAQSIGDDLKLTPEMVVAVAVEIAEQVAAAEDPIIFWKGGGEDPIEEDEEGPPGDRRNLTAAWHLPHKINVTNVAHLVASSRPAEPKTA